MKVNGHEILVSTNIAKLSRILQRWFKGICYTSRFFGMVIAHYLNPSSENLIHHCLFLKNWFRLFWKNIDNLSRGSSKTFPNTFENILKILPQDFLRVLLQALKVPSLVFWHISKTWFSLELFWKKNCWF